MTIRKKSPDPAVLLDELSLLRTAFDSRTHDRQRQIITALCAVPIRNLRLLKRLHAIMSAIRAFADNDDLYVAAGRLMKSIPARIRSLPIAQRRTLDDTGLAETTLVFEFSFDLARWISLCFKDEMDIAWNRYDDPERLDALLAHFVTPAEQQTWDDGKVSTRQWVRLARGTSSANDFAWLARQMMGDTPRRRIWSALYDAAEVPLRWRLANSRGSITFNEVPWLGTNAVRNVWRQPPSRIDHAIRQPLDQLEWLDEHRAGDVLNVARDALAARQREVYAFTYANPKEVYLVSVGCGVHMAVFGVVPDRRLSLEGNYGYIILARGRPIGYGGASPLFQQANTGINIFDDFRKGESAFLFVQVLRTWHELFGSNRFIANPYQFGADNAEALASGAFWFYYKLGFRPVTAALRRLAGECAARRKSDRKYLVDRATMKRLCSVNLELCLSGARSQDRFDERWLGALALQATTHIAAQTPIDRKAAVRKIVECVASSLSANRRGWTRNELDAFGNLAPVIGLIPELAAWSRVEKQDCVSLMRAKGSHQERGFVQRVAGHARLRAALATIGQSNLDA